MSRNASRLAIEQTGRVLTVTFNNPPRHFFDEAMSLELDDLTRALARDSAIGAAIFTGTEDRFITHFDVPDLLRGARSTPFPVDYTAARAAATLARLATSSRTVDRALRSTPARHAVFMARTYRSLNRLNRMDKVTIAAVNGLALGMGCVLALACDIRLIADEARIGLPETALAMLAGAGGTQRLTRMLGTSRALALLLDGGWLTAAEAEDLGLVHAIATRAELSGRAHAFAERLARRSPVINREIKRCVYDAGTRPLGAAFGSRSRQPHHHDVNQPSRAQPLRLQQPLGNCRRTHRRRHPSRLASIARTRRPCAHADRRRSSELKTTHTESTSCPTPPHRSPEL